MSTVSLTQSSPVPPFEEEALFNPAFLSVLLFGAVKDYGEKAGRRPMPLVLAYLITALALHRPTREALPSRVNAQMGEWVQAHPEFLSHLGSNVQSLRPLVSTGICFSLRHGVLIGGDGVLRIGQLLRRPRGLTTSVNVRNCISAAEFLGRWLAQQGDPGTILAIWGLRI